ncbi:MAG TPA: biotin/lipoyl-binding protein, partial [Gammaproteobacteria bacterium]
MNSKSDLLKQLKIDKEQQSAPNIKYPWVWAGLAAALLLAALWLMLDRNPAFAVSTSMARIEAGGGNGGQITLQATGYVTARRRATVSSKVMGKVEELLVEEGDYVETGQILAKLDDSNIRKDYLLTESQLLA